MSRTLVAILAGLLVAIIIGFGTSIGLAAAGAEPLSSVWVVGTMIGTFTTLGIMNVGGRKRVATADADTRAAALSMKPPPGSGLVVVFREGFMGKRNGVDLSLDGQEVTQLMSPQFTAMRVPPGRHTLKAVLAGVANVGSKPGEASFELGEGQAALFRITLAMKMSTSDVVLARLDDPAAALAKLARMKMVMAAA